jgi:hypothetical protein
LKILLYTDLAIRHGQLFCHRDLGLLTKAFRQLGHNALLVVPPAGDSPSKIKQNGRLVADALGNAAPQKGSLLKPTANFETFSG